MPSPISEHTVPRPEADAARYVAEGYWAGIPIGRLLRQVADRWEFVILTLACRRAGLTDGQMQAPSGLPGWRCDALWLLDDGTWTARVRSAQGHEIPARKVNLHAIR